MLAALLTRAGASVEPHERIADDEASHRAAFARGLEADVLVTSGGVSVGPHDLVRATIAELGAEEVFWGVAMRPGKPLSFSVRGDTLVFGLPGNPVSSFVGTVLFVLPAIRALQGHPQSCASLRGRSAGRAREQAPAARRLPARPPRSVRRLGDAPSAGRPGVAHDRPSRRGGRARTHPARRRRAAGRARPSATCR